MYIAEQCRSQSGHEAHASVAGQKVKHLQCMEVWGGNQAADRGVVMPGIDAWIYSRPCMNGAAGGDVHYVSTCAGGLLVRLVVADIAGHGEPVAKTGEALRWLMQRFINRHKQSSLVRSMNQEFSAASDSGVFATALVMTFECMGNKLVLSNCGHPPPLWYQAKRGRWVVLEPGTRAPEQANSTGMPWGIEHDADYCEFHSELAVGDIVLCYTDSIAEAKGPDGEVLGTSGLLRMAEALGNVRPSQVIPRLLAEIEKNDPDYSSRDDVTCLAFRPNGLRRTAPIWDLALAPIRWALAAAGLKVGYAGWRRAAWDAPIGYTGSPR